MASSKDSGCRPFQIVKDRKQWVTKGFYDYLINNLLKDKPLSSQSQIYLTHFLQVGKRGTTIIFMNELESSMVKESILALHNYIIASFVLIVPHLTLEITKFIHFHDKPDALSQK